MAGRSQESSQKRQREKSKQEKQAAKRARRAERKDADAPESTGRGEMEIMEEYEALSRSYNNDEIEEEEYEQRKEELFEELGLAIGE